MASKRNPRRVLLWLQGLLVFCMVLLFGFGFFFQHVLGKIEATIASGPTIAQFDSKLSTKIGKTFTKEDHRKIVEIVGGDDEVLENMTKSSRALSKLIFRISGCAVFLSLFSIFLIIRGRAEVAPPVVSHDSPADSNP